MAVAVGVLVEIVLVVVVSRIIAAQRQELDRQRLRVFGLLLAEDLLDGRQLRGREVINAGAVACAFVMTLTVERERGSIAAKNIRTRKPRLTCVSSKSTRTVSA